MLRFFPSQCSLGMSQDGSHFVQSHFLLFASLQVEWNLSFMLGDFDLSHVICASYRRRARTSDIDNHDL